MKKPNVKYRVNIFECESGWGSRHEDTRWFNSEEEAREFCKNYNNDPKNTYDYYWRADMIGWREKK